jgi:hypothetical protein
MACWMERNINSVDRKMLVISQSIDECLTAHAGTQDMLAGCSAKVTITARPGMVSMSVGDNGMRYRSPWIDIEITRRAVETVWRYFKQIWHGELSLL